MEDPEPRNNHEIRKKYEPGNSRKVVYVPDWRGLVGVL